MGRTTMLNQPSTCQDRSHISSNPSSTCTNLEHVDQASYTETTTGLSAQTHPALDA